MIKNEMTANEIQAYIKPLISNTCEPPPFEKYICNNALLICTRQNENTLAFIKHKNNTNISGTIATMIFTRSDSMNRKIGQSTTPNAHENKKFCDKYAII